ncbi:hypothetical protein M8J75_014179 [Diaphorina citri]|nr:hypothetical protein M8J75_014179 [Diaphorina citri]
MLQHVARTPVACTSLLRVASSSHCSKPWRSSDNNQYAPYTSSLHVTSSSSLRPPYGLFASRNFFPQTNALERERGYDRSHRSHILAAILFSQTVYSRLDTEFQDYIDKLELWCYYWGLYVLIFVAIVILVSCVFSCGAIYQEIVQLLQLVSTEGAPSGIS